MKYSIYNSTIKINDRHGILYNAMSDKFILLSSNAYGELMRYDSDLLVKINPILYEQMCDIGAIVPNDMNQTDEFKRIMLSKMEDESC